MCGWLAACWPALGSDIAKGYTFSPAEKNVTHTKLNNLVDLASINSTFFTDKSATTTPAAGDLVLLYSVGAGGFRKCSLDNIVFSNKGLITSQTEDSAPATNDYLLTYSTANTALRKSSLQNLVFGNSGLMTLQPRSTNAPVPGALFLLSSNGVYQTYALTNIFQEWWRWMPLSTNSPTNFLLSVHTAPTNTDGLLIWDSVGKTNKATTLLGLFTNLPTVAAGAAGTTNTDYIPIVSTATNANNPYGTNNTISKVAVSNIFGWNFTGAPFPVPASSGVTTNTHGLPGKPQWVRLVLVCTNAEFGYASNDEVGIEAAYVSGANSPAGSSGSDATKLYFAYGGGASAWNITRKDTGLAVSPTKANWNLKFYARWFPW